MKAFKYRKLDHPKEAFLVFIWCAQVMFMSILIIAQRARNLDASTTLFNLGFGCGMLLSNYLCYKVHNVKALSRELEQNARKFISDIKTLFEAESIVNERDEKGF